MKRKSILLMLLAVVPVAFVYIAISSFTLRKGATPPVLAVVFTKSVNNITHESAICQFRMSVTNVSKVKFYGVCVGTRIDPTINLMNFSTTTGVKPFGDYIMKMNGFKPACNFYARAYVKVDTTVVYGNSVAFKTLPTPKGQK
ncbi:MAG: hypothetical protein WBC06_10260 [Chitinophagaceae bacterium]